MMGDLHKGDPSLSVVIPTTGKRPLLLRRAIESCLEGAPTGGIEVLVVVNGDTGPVEADGHPDERVRFLGIDAQNANRARNFGLREAKGEYLRFLDDDDYLEPVNARAQLDALRESGADVSSGGVSFVQEGQEVGNYLPHEADDFVAEIFAQRASTLPVALLFRRAVLEGAQWDPERSYLQDVAWVHSLVRRGEVRWHPFPRVVGAWVQHREQRTSVDVASRLGEKALRMAVSIIEGSIDDLAAQGRLTDRRKSSAAKALWDYAHQGFSTSPRYWSRIAKKALKLDPNSRPVSWTVSGRAIRWLPPLVAEWLLFPIRYIARQVVR